MPSTEPIDTTPPVRQVTPVSQAGREARIRTLLLGRKAETGNTITLVREGLPLSSIKRLYKTLKVEQSTILALMGMSQDSYRQRQAAQQRLSPIESDRLYRLARIEARASDVFENAQVAADWLKTPNRALGVRPLDLLDTEAGTDTVDRLLTRIEHGVYS